MPLLTDLLGKGLNVANKALEKEVELVGRPITKGIIQAGRQLARPQEQLPFDIGNKLKSAREKAEPVVQTIGENILVPSNVVPDILLAKVGRIGLASTKFGTRLGLRSATKNIPHKKVMMGEVPIRVPTKTKAKIDLLSDELAVVISSNDVNLDITLKPNYLNDSNKTVYAEITLATNSEALAGGSLRNLADAVDQFNYLNRGVQLYANPSNGRLKVFYESLGLVDNVKAGIPGDQLLAKDARIAGSRFTVGKAGFLRKNSVFPEIQSKAQEFLAVNKAGRNKAESTLDVGRRSQGSRATINAEPVPDYGVNIIDSPRGDRVVSIPNDVNETLAASNVTAGGNVTIDELATAIMDTAEVSPMRAAATAPFNPEPVEAYDSLLAATKEMVNQYAISKRDISDMVHSLRIISDDVLKDSAASVKQLVKEVLEAGLQRRTGGQVVHSGEIVEAGARSGNIKTPLRALEDTASENLTRRADLIAPSRVPSFSPEEIFDKGVVAATDDPELFESISRVSGGDLQGLSETLSRNVEEPIDMTDDLFKIWRAKPSEVTRLRDPEVRIEFLKAFLRGATDAPTQGQPIRETFLQQMARRGLGDQGA